MTDTERPTLRSERMHRLRLFQQEGKAIPRDEMAAAFIELVQSEEEAVWRAETMLQSLHPLLQQGMAAEALALLGTWDTYLDRVPNSGIDSQLMLRGIELGDRVRMGDDVSGKEVGDFMKAVVACGKADCKSAAENMVAIRMCLKHGMVDEALETLDSWLAIPRSPLSILPPLSKPETVASELLVEIPSPRR